MLFKKCSAFGVREHSGGTRANFRKKGDKGDSIGNQSEMRHSIKGWS